MNAKKVREQKTKQKLKFQSKIKRHFYKKCATPSNANDANPTQPKKFVKYDPYGKAKQIQKAERNPLKNKDFEQTLLRKQEYLEKRKKEKLIMLKRTKQGQPVFSNQIEKLLEKINK